MAAAQEFADLDHRRLSSRRPIRLVAHKNAVCLADEQPPIAVRAAVEHPSLTCHRRLPSPSSRIGGVFDDTSVADQRVSGIGLHYTSWCGRVAIRGGG